MRRLSTLVLLTAALAPAAAWAQSHDIRGFVPQRGLDFVAAQLPSYVPRRLTPPDMTRSLACVEATQRKTKIDLTVDDLTLKVPRPGRLVLDVRLSASGTGELFAKDIIACVGDLTCQDSFSISGVRAIVQLDVALTGGKPQVGMAAVDVQLDADDLELRFSGCAVGDLVSWVIDFAKGWIVDFVVAKIEQVAAEAIAPKIEELLVGMAYSGAVGSVKFQAALEDLALDAAGLALGAAIDINTPYPAEACVAPFDRGEPKDLPGERPDLTLGSALHDRPHLALATNFGLINDALYHAWRSGLLCLDAEKLEALGLHVPLDMVGELLPGFPPGTRLGLEVLLKKPLTIAGVTDDMARLTLRIEDLDITLTGELPNGTSKRLNVVVAAAATAAIGIDRGSNALIGQLIGVELSRLEFDQLTASQYGFDVERIRYVVEHHVVPHVMEQLGQMPLTGPVFSAAGYAVILRELSTTDAYLTIKTDLFRIPTDDFSPPDTSLVRYPSGVVSPRDAIIEVSGADARVPFELLQYRVWVNGEERPASFIRTFTVGKAGETGTYEVEVRALDLSGNVDPTPATTTVMVDGKPPQLVLRGSRMRQESGPIPLEWSVTDDLTPAGQLGARIVIYEVLDPTDVLSAVELDTRVLPPGSLSATVDGLASDRLYRIELRVTDQAGNDASASILVDLRTGGCRAAGGASGGATLLLAVALAALAGRRRRH
jgi:hypothetical protein